MSSTPTEVTPESTTVDVTRPRGEVIDRAWPRITSPGRPVPKAASSVYDKKEIAGLRHGAAGRAGSPANVASVVVVEVVEPVQAVEDAFILDGEAQRRD